MNLTPAAPFKGQADTGPWSFGLIPAPRSQVSEIFMVLVPLGLMFLTLRQQRGPLLTASYPNLGVTACFLFRFLRPAGSSLRSGAVLHASPVATTRPDTGSFLGMVYWVDG